MKTIYKFEITSRVVPMPAGAVLLHVGEQHIGHDSYALFVWAKVDTTQPCVSRHLEVVGTGWDDRDGGDGKLVGTVQQRSGLVFHIFDHGEIV